jgi:NADPH:quinone reductase-like Zn-dependent oxidoreductase
MAASAGTVYAVVSVKAGDELYRSPVGRDDWTRVGTLMAASDGLAVLGKAAWFGGSPTLWATMDGVHWHKHAFTCPSDLSLAGIAASSGSHVAFLCAFAEGMFHTAKSVLRSVNGGQTEHLAGTAPDAGDVYGFAVPPHTNVVAIAAVTPGPDYVYRSANGGKTWNSVVIQGTSGGVGLASLQFVSARTGWLIISGPASIPGAGLLRTRNSGLTWHAVKF